MATTSDHDLAENIATSTGDLLLALRLRLEKEEAPPGYIRQEGDRLAHEHILKLLEQERPEDAVLSEEGSANEIHPDRLSSERVWIVDPLDGTREFGETGRNDWAVHVAMVENGHPTVGAVALPSLGMTLSTKDELVEFKNKALHKPPRLVVSRTRPASESLIIAERMGAKLIEMGSAGAKAMAVVRGEADAYIHSGGQYEWDSCAPVAVALLAGFHASRKDGSPLIYNQNDSYMPDLVICHPKLSEVIIDSISKGLL